jgi:torulene dioxygenase
MTVEEVPWPNDAGFDTNYEELEPVELIVKGTIPSFAAGVLCEL